MPFELTTKQNIVGKPEVTSLAMLLSTKSGPYNVYQFDTFQDLLEYAYIEGQAYTHGVVDVERHAQESASGTAKTNTPRSYEYFLYADIISIDIDKPTLPEHTLDFIQSQAWAQSAGLIYPSSSYTPEVPRWHLVYRLSERIFDREEYTALALALYKTLTLTPDERLSSPVQLSFGTKFRDPAIRGKPLTLTYVNENAVLDVAWLRSLETYKEPEPVRETLVIDDEAQLAKNYHNTDEGSYWVELHMQQTPAVREKIVLDALNTLLPHLGINTSYDLWTQVWMAAHHGSPTQAVHDFILSHPSVHWSDGEAGKNKFSQTWVTHKAREGGYTVASLFWLAERLGGWLKYTPFDLPDEDWQIISVSRITSWSEEQEQLPRRVLLHSQTASGKTRNLVFMYERLGNPKTVIFVPTMKLAAELAHTLTSNNVPATLYFNPETNRIHPADVLRGAEVLVTTLQTFTTRVYYPGIMQDYRLVYVEESDQLLAQFSLAKSVFLASHVSERQAQAGFEVLKEMCALSEYVYFVDATMTQVTVQTVKALSPADLQPLMLRNTYVKNKAAVEFLQDKMTAYTLGIQSLVKRKKVVVACDTKATATEFYQLVQMYGLHLSARTLLITKDTENDPQVIRFMQDVNAAAKEYDLIVYNSVMASGVSVTSVRPDVLIQIAEYLPPRSNLQILNRFREQLEVFVFYSQKLNLYGPTAQELTEKAEQRVKVEQELMQLPLAARTEIAELRKHLAAIAGADAYAQARNARIFYRRLLRDDGRHVVDKSRYTLLENLKVTLSDVREARKEQADYIREHWRDFRPVGVDMLPSPGMTALDVAAGIEHYRIRQILNEYIPQQEEQARVFDVVQHFSAVTPVLSVFANQDLAYRGSEDFLGDPTRPVTTFYNNVTQLTLLGLLLDVWGDQFERVHTKESLIETGKDFLLKLDQYQQMFDLVSRNKDEQYRDVLQKYSDLEERVLVFSRILLRMLGLKITRKRGQFSVGNIRDALDFLHWRYHWLDDFRVDFRGTSVQFNQSKIAWAQEHFDGLKEADQQLVMARWNRDQSTFFLAVKSVVEDIDFLPSGVLN